MTGRVRDVSNREPHTFEYEVSTGIIANITSIHKFGGISDLPQALTPVTDTGFYRMPTTLTSLEIVSDNTDDSSAGAGAQKVTVTGIGTNWRVTEDIITMNGTTPVALAKQFYRVYRIKASESGTYAGQGNASHLGKITLRETGGGDVWGNILVENSQGTGQSVIGFYTSPKNTIMHIDDQVLYVESLKPASLFLWVREHADNVSPPFGTARILEYKRGLSGTFTRDYKYPNGPYVGPCDIGFMAVSTSAALSTVSVEFTLLVEHVNG